MRIYIVSGFGEGRTKLSAFDAALKDAGIQNYNLIYLSSIIPPQTRVVKKKRLRAIKEEYGNRLYIVRSEIRSDRVGRYIAAGLGWYQKDDLSGVFVEHEEEGETEAAVKMNLERQIIDSLRDLCKFRNLPFNESKVVTQISIGPVNDQPCSALVAAVFKSEAWT